MLIGSNFNWNFVTGNVAKSSEGPVAVDSKLGWLLSWPIDSGEMNNVSHTCVVISGVPVNPTFDSKNDVLVKSLCEFGMLNPLEFCLPLKKMLKLVHSLPESPFIIIDTQLACHGSQIIQRFQIICHYVRVA